MRFTIFDYEDSFGAHRFSNNEILEKLQSNLIRNDNLLFVWWVEKMFLHPNNEAKRTFLEHRDWFGVMHVPLLSPCWAMTKDSQNDLAKLYFSKAWRSALTRCRGIICLSEHMASQLRVLYPNLNVFTAKHPTELVTTVFSPDAFLEKKQIVLIGAWLRNFQAYFQLKTEFKKILLLNKYAKSYIENSYAKYSLGCQELLGSVQKIEFLRDDEYDALLSSSLVFLGLHETSANNSVCECIARNTPFIANRHPAVIEYCGEEYPLLVNSYDEDIDVSRVLDAHEYLKHHHCLKSSLQLDEFVQRIKFVYEKIVAAGGGNGRIGIYVITPSCNSADTLWQTLESVYQQNTEGCMLYHHVQDCQSTDGTVKILSKWREKVSVDRKSGYSFSYSSCSDAGMYDAIAKGFSSFSIWDNEWMTWLNADDQMAPDAIQTVRRVNQINSDIGWLTGYPSVRTEEREEIVFEVLFATALVRAGFCDSKTWRTIQQEGTFWKFKHWRQLNINEMFIPYKFAGDFSLWCGLAALTELYQVQQTIAWFNRRQGQKSVQFRDYYFKEVDQCKSRLGGRGSSIKSHFTANIVNLEKGTVENVSVEML